MEGESVNKLSAHVSVWEVKMSEVNKSNNKKIAHYLELWTWLRSKIEKVKKWFLLGETEKGLLGQAVV